MYIFVLSYQIPLWGFLFSLPIQRLWESVSVQERKVRKVTYKYVQIKRDVVTVQNFPTEVSWYISCVQLYAKINKMYIWSFLLLYHWNVKRIKLGQNCSTRQNSIQSDSEKRKAHDWHRIETVSLRTETQAVRKYLYFRNYLYGRR